MIKTVMRAVATPSRPSFPSCPRAVIRPEVAIGLADMIMAEPVAWPEQLPRRSAMPAWRSPRLSSLFPPPPTFLSTTTATEPRSDRSLL